MSIPKCVLVTMNVSPFARLSLAFGAPVLHVAKPGENVVRVPYGVIRQLQIPEFPGRTDVDKA